ncbi:hypothetical protein P879_08238 [Paragonimus westermani]|uniref:Mitochondrial inner membrane protein Mpv17 n=1 Tax=Paragonimus westermani TaxID=34504 RepID=A0A8T0DGG8_9TREM|nr:hypothetical protein P879_08238 [Paragonimus westermani]
MGNSFKHAATPKSSPLVSRCVQFQPLLKNVMIAAALMMLGEILAEELKYCLLTDAQERKKSKKRSFPHPSENPTDSERNASIICDCWRKKAFSWTNIDIYEVARLGLFGAFQGTYQHLYYSWLDGKLVGNSATVVAKKVALDELLVGPASLFVFFTFNGYCYTRSLSGGLEHSRRLFWQAYVADLAFWPLVQTVNFALLPTRYRVPYIAAFMFVWNTYLCVLNFRKVSSVAF